MTRKKVWLVAAAVLAGAGLAATFTWVAGGQDYSWMDCGNWTKVGLGAYCFPGTSSDDATIPSGGYTVELRTCTMDDLVVNGSADFTTDSTARTLTVDSININGAALVTFRNEAKIAG